MFALINLTHFLVTPFLYRDFMHPISFLSAIANWFYFSPAPPLLVPLPNYQRVTLWRIFSPVPCFFLLWRETDTRDEFPSTLWRDLWQSSGDRQLVLLSPPISLPNYPYKDLTDYGGDCSMLSSPVPYNSHNCGNFKGYAR
jgi:hypothetical protein